MLPLWLGCGPGIVEVDKTDLAPAQPGPTSPTSPADNPAAPAPTNPNPTPSPTPSPIPQPATPLPVSGPCGELCKAVGGCTSVWPSADACGQECAAMQKVMRPTVTDAFIGCGKKATCAGFDKKVCLKTGADIVQIAVTYPLVDRLCEKINACIGGTMKPADCIALRTDANMVGLLEQLKIYTEAVHTCIASCIQATSCIDLYQNGATLAGQCAEKCGTRPGWTTN